MRANGERNVGLSIPENGTYVSDRPAGRMPADRRLRVLFVSWRDLAHRNAGGLRGVVDVLIEGLRRRGHTAALVCGGEVGHRPYPVLSAGGTYDHYLRAPWLARRFRHWDLLVDVVNGFPYFSPLWWPGPSCASSTTCTAISGASTSRGPIAAAGGTVERRLVPPCTAAPTSRQCLPSTSEALQGLGVPRERIHLVHNGIDHRPRLSDPGRSRTSRRSWCSPGWSPTRASTGSWMPGKRCSPVIGGRLVVVGEGPERAALEARRLPGVEFVGSCPTRSASSSCSARPGSSSTAPITRAGASPSPRPPPLATPAVAYDVERCA